MTRFGCSWCLFVGLLILVVLPSCKDEGSGIECCTCFCYEPNIPPCDVEADAYLTEIGEDLECSDVCETQCYSQRACKSTGAWECTEDEKQALEDRNE